MRVCEALNMVASQFRMSSEQYNLQPEDLMSKLVSILPVCLHICPQTYGPTLLSCLYKYEMSLP